MSKRHEGVTIYDVKKTTKGMAQFQVHLEIHRFSIGFPSSNCHSFILENNKLIVINNRDLVTTVLFFGNELYK